MSVYLLNTSVIPNKGVYILRDPAKGEIEEIKKEDFVSAIGHPATARLLSFILGIEVPFNRIAISMEKGDKALVFKLKQRPPEGVVIDSLEKLKEIGYELLIMERIQ